MENEGIIQDIYQAQSKQYVNIKLALLQRSLCLIAAESPGTSKPNASLVQSLVQEVICTHFTVIK